MDLVALFKGFSDLGPSMGAVAAIAGISYYIIKLMSKVITNLLELFAKHTEAIEVLKRSLEENMDEHAKALTALSRNVEINTRSTEQFIRLFEKKV